MKRCGVVFAALILTILAGCDAGQPVARVEPVVVPRHVAAPADESNWSVDQEINPVSGVSIETAELKYHSRDQYIIVRKTGEKLDCYVNTGDFLETTQNLDSRVSTVRFRFDGGKMATQGWSMSDDNTALFAPRHCAAFLAALRSAHTLAFEYKPADKTPTAVTFFVAGFPQSFKTDYQPAAHPRVKQPTALAVPSEAEHAALPLCSDVTKTGTASYPSCRTN